jgi:hypothetical protein
MTIRRKVPVLLALTSISLLVVVAATSRVLLLDSFVQLEEREPSVKLANDTNAIRPSMTMHFA